MNQRSTKIVQLLSREKDEITVAGFAEYFDVSQKTIRNDLKEINHILDENEKKYIEQISEKYSTNNIFKKQEKKYGEEMAEINLPVKHKEGMIKKIIKFIKSIFKRSD